MITVGVLALQGGFDRHRQAVAALGYPVREVRDEQDLKGLGAIILPGGESTVMGKLLVRRGLADPLRDRILDGLPVFATCAGAILLAKDIEGSQQFRLRTLDVEVVRNAYGTQIDSFQTNLTIPTLGSRLVPGVFIRAPQFRRLSSGVDVVGRDGQLVVVVRQGRQVAATFHPELTDDLRLHRWFLGLAEQASFRA